MAPSLRQSRPHLAEGVYQTERELEKRVVIAEAVLSLLGLGAQPPTPSWGAMLNTAQQLLESAPWMAWWPGLAVFCLALSFNQPGA